MSITDKNSVLILGAGVSRPFGLPLGDELLTQIKNQTERELGHIRNEHLVFRRAEIFIREACYLEKAFYEAPMLGAIGADCEDSNANFQADKLKSYLEQLEKLDNLLANQTSETIDDFIVENPSCANLTKIGIAACFMKSCYFLDSHDKLCLHPFPARYNRTRNTKVKSGTVEYRNWVHLLINIIRHGIRLGNVTKNNKVQIITFNYEKVLEFVLSKQFSNTEKGYGSYTDYVDIIHVHGQCGDFTDIVHPGKTCLDWAKGINVVNEPDDTIPNEIFEAREKARKLIRSAKKIYACGFSFAAPNCRLLGMEATEHTVGSGRTISYCNYDGNVGIKFALEKYKNYRHIPRENFSTRSGTSTILEAAGTLDKPLSVADWLKLGYVGELPG